MDENVLEVGISEDGREVIVNHPRLLTDKDGVGHIVFSPEQARNLAFLLIEKSCEIDGTKIFWPSATDGQLG